MQTSFGKAAATLLSFALLAGGVARAADSPQQGAAISAISPGALPAGQAERYVIPNYYSVIAGAGRSFTGVAIQNNSGVSCNVAVRCQFSFGMYRISV